LTVLYQIYLSRFDVAQFEVDSVTQIVAEQTQQLVIFFGYDAQIIENSEQSSVKFFVEGKYVARVVEGCNAISVLILFVAFIIAFKGSWKHTLLYLLFGTVLIYVLNIFRIAVISIALYYYPEQEHLIHGVLFPLLIYGVVFLLWVIWVNKFSVYATKNLTK
jgi:exosortase family protein XrtF